MLQLHEVYLINKRKYRFLSLKPLSLSSLPSYQTTPIECFGFVVGKWIDLVFLLSSLGISYGISLETECLLDCARWLWELLTCGDIDRRDSSNGTRRSWKRITREEIKNIQWRFDKKRDLATWKSEFWIGEGLGGNEILMTGPITSYQPTTKGMIQLGPTRVKIFELGMK